MGHPSVNPFLSLSPTSPPASNSCLHFEMEPSLAAFNKVIASGDFKCYFYVPLQQKLIYAVPWSHIVTWCHCKKVEVYVSGIYSFSKAGLSPQLTAIAQSL